MEEVREKQSCGSHPAATLLKPVDQKHVADRSNTFHVWRKALRPLRLGNPRPPGERGVPGPAGARIWVSLRDFDHSISLNLDFEDFEPSQRESGAKALWRGMNQGTLLGNGVSSCYGGISKACPEKVICNLLTT